MLDKKSFFDRIKRDREEAGDRLMESAESQDLVPELETVPDLQAALGQPKTQSSDAVDSAPINEPDAATATTAETAIVFGDESPTETETVRPDEELQAAPLDPIALSMLDQIVGTYENTPIQSVSEIYRSAEMEQDEKKSIFIADRFLKALPSELEESVKRETVLNIIRISGIEIESLLRDAKQRVDVLDAVLNVTNLETQNRDRRDLGLIVELEKRIRDLIEIRNARKNFRAEQNQIVEEERDKLQRIIRFLQPNQF
ncbi:MAG: hypothetical protein Q4A52_01935 [Bacillota bacterium]|nr:hypothetical protein [Bacillota bacterium]